MQGCFGNLMLDHSDFNKWIYNHWLKNLIISDKYFFPPQSNFDTVFT
jgi:hypothetical protein